MRARNFFGLALILGLCAVGQTLAQSTSGYSLGSGTYNKRVQFGGANGFLACQMMIDTEAWRSPQGRTGGYVQFGGGGQQGESLETLVVPNDRSEKVISRTVLEAGRLYIFEVSGTFDDWGNTPAGIDAVWCFAEWRCGKQGEVWDQLRINGKGMTEVVGQPIPYNPQHLYRIYYLGQGKPVEFYLSDALGRPGDNKGSVTVKMMRTNQTGGGGAGGGNGGGSDTSQGLAGTWRWNLMCATKFPNGTGQMKITQDPDGKYTGAFTSQWGEVRSGTITEGVQQGDEVTFNFVPGGWLSYLIWKGKIIRDGSGVRIEGVTLYYGGDDCRFTMYREGNAGGGGTIGGGICADTRTLAIMDEWLARAIPLQNRQPGWSVRYESWGRLVGRSPTAIMNISGPPDTPMTRCEWLWRHTADRGSTNLGTLREYVERRRQQ